MTKILNFLNSLLSQIDLWLLNNRNKLNGDQILQFGSGDPRTKPGQGFPDGQPEMVLLIQTQSYAFDLAVVQHA